jgi:hypothetical protein
MLRFLKTFHLEFHLETITAMTSAHDSSVLARMIHCARNGLINLPFISSTMPSRPYLPFLTFSFDFSKASESQIEIKGSANPPLLTKQVTGFSYHANQIVLELTRAADRKGTRTLGVITKPDTLITVITPTLANINPDAWTPSPFIHANLGAKNGLRIFREVNAKYWIATHDEVQRSTGPLHYFFSENKVLSKDAVEVAFNDEKLGLEKPWFVDVENGQTFLAQQGALRETLRISLCRHGVWKAFDFTRLAKIDERTDQGLGNMRQIFDLFGNLVA